MDACSCCCGKKVSYIQLRDHILGIANQKVQMAKLVPMELGSVENKQGEATGEEEEWERTGGV